MGLSILPDIFQRLMFSLVSDLPFAQVYIDDLAIVTDGTYEDHIDKVSIVLD